MGCFFTRGWSNNERVLAELLGQFQERDLCVKPPGILRDAFHRVAGVIADQIKALPGRHESLEARPVAEPRELKITRPVTMAEKPRLQFLHIGGEIRLKMFLARPDVSDNLRAVEKRKKHPLVEHGAAVQSVHPFGAGFHLFDCVVEDHRPSFCNSSWSFLWNISTSAGDGL